MAKKREMQDIEELKKSVVDEAPALQEAEEKLDFDAWFAMRGSKIPPQHHKEIIKADFRGRGLAQCESLKDFDIALKKYGVKLA